MDIKIIHSNRSARTLPTDQILNLSRQSNDHLLKALSNDFTHLPLHKTNAKVQVRTVEEAVQCYEQDLKQRVYQRSRQKILALRHLYNLCTALANENKVIYFCCFCMDEINPKPYDHPCHCQPLRRIILAKFNKNLVIKTESSEPQIKVDRPVLGFNGLN